MKKVKKNVFFSYLLCLQNRNIILLIKMTYYVLNSSPDATAILVEQGAQLNGNFYIECACRLRSCVVKIRLLKIRFTKYKKLICVKNIIRTFKI